MGFELPVYVVRTNRGTPRRSGWIGPAAPAQPDGNFLVDEDGDNLIDDAGNFLTDG
jgi:hypothetical protein